MPMTLDQVLKKLKSLGTAQAVKIYKRHGAGDNVYGVSFAHLNKLKKEIKTDQALAEALWESGNVDARHLALMIADPEQVTEATLNSWVKDMNYHGACDMLAGLIKNTPYAKMKAEEWTKSNDEWVGRTGWDLIGGLAMNHPNLPDSYFEKYLKVIEKEIHQAKNFTRHAMNMALIGIGVRNSNLKKLALAAAKRIGKVEVDHGETSCKTPDAASYIEKTLQYRAKKKKK